MNLERVFFGPQVRGVEPDILDHRIQRKPGSVSGKRDSLLRMSQKHMPALSRAAMTQPADPAPTTTKSASNGAPEPLIVRFLRPLSVTLAALARGDKFGSR